MPLIDCNNLAFMINIKGSLFHVSKHERLKACYLSNEDQPCLMPFFL